jgi:hypothetical protein
MLGAWGQVHFLPYIPLHFLVLRLVSVVSSEPYQVIAAQQVVSSIHQSSSIFQCLFQDSAAIPSS